MGVLLRRKKLPVAMLGISLVFSLTLSISEGGFRLLLFSRLPVMEKFRNPGLYADYFSDSDWWKLYYLFGRSEHQPAPHPHPLLGWVGEFSSETYRHYQANEIAHRRVILLYGDSFAHCL